VSLYDRAAIIPGRSLTRSKKIFNRWAVSADGAVITDTEGKQYLDMGCGLGAISLGYRQPTASGPGVCTLPHFVEVMAAEAVLKHVAPWASSVRFTKTGSESTHAAYRIAKAATGRPDVLTMHGAYHGWHEWCAEAWLDYQYSADTWPHLALQPERVAAVFYEPPRFGPVNQQWLQWLRDYCTAYGILLVFDEMIWGGRFALGGLSGFSGVVPDLACYGKAFGNGQAVAFVVGREALAEHGEMVSGTFSGDVTGLRAVLETLQTYATEPVIDTLWQRGRQLYAEWAQHVPASFCTLSQPAPLLGLNFAHPEDKEPFVEALAQRGVLCYGNYLMTMYDHAPEHMGWVARAAGDAAKEFL
jgi:glutamate-1-semialdehyde aminotransferase